MKLAHKFLVILIALPAFSGCKLPRGNKPKTHSSVTYVTTESEFKASVLEAKKPTIAKFHAEWCGACKKIEPLYQEVAKELGDTYNFVTVNVDNNKAVAQKYGVKGIPAFLFFKDGKEVKLKNPLIGGSLSKDDFKAALKEAF